MALHPAVWLGWPQSPWQLEPEATEQCPLRLVGLDDAADSQLLTAVQWQDYVRVLNAPELLQESSRARAQSRFALPTGQRFPKRVREEADKDVRLGTFGLLVPDGTDLQLALLDSEGRLGLGKLKV